MRRCLIIRASTGFASLIVDSKSLVDCIRELRSSGGEMLLDWFTLAVVFLAVEQLKAGELDEESLRRRSALRPAKENREGNRKTVSRGNSVYLEGGGYRMGLNDSRLLKTGEYPMKEIRVKSFSIERHLVTNADYMAFKSDKPHYTTDAERSGRSWVFVRQKTIDSRHDGLMTHRDGHIWQAVKNATWEQPYGPGSSVTDRLNYPVVHISYYDAFAFCVWANKRLPTEYEWEYAARGGENDTKYPWGNETEVMRSNLWQGRFPDINSGKDGYDGLSPVDAFPAQNDYDLYDMIGNVWEWTSTVFTVPRVNSDPQNPEYTVKGGSYMDVYEGLSGYEVRNSARRGFSPSYSAANLGFRCSESGARARAPVLHRLEDTWDYKVHQMAKAGVIGPMRQAGKYPEEL